MKKILFLFMLLFLYSCKESQPEVEDFYGNPYKYDALQGNWILNYIVYKSKKLEVSNICNATGVSELKIEKDTAYLKDACSSLVKFKMNKIDFRFLRIKLISATSSDCKPIYLCDKNPKNIDGKIFENYNRQILQNFSNIWVDSDTVKYQIIKYNTQIDTLIFIDDLNNRAIYYKNNSR